MRNTAFQLIGRSVLVAVAVFAVLLVLPVSSFGAFPGGNGKIAFGSTRDGNFEIYVMNADGSAQTRLTDSPAVDEYPAWSPNGQKIAFTTNRDGNYEIYVMNADGSAQTDLTNNPAADYYATWSPDGQKIAFTTERDGNVEVYVMNADGSAQTDLTNNPAADYYPVWSPDGQKIAFMSNRDGNWEIYVMNADGSGQTRLTYNAAHDQAFSWSPDGRKIAFQTNRDGNYEIYVMNADGSGQTDLTNNPALDEAPAWSPDGQKIAFDSYRDGNDEVYVMNADGSGQTRLTNNPAVDQVPSWQSTPLISDGQFNGNSSYQPAPGTYTDLAAAPDPSATGLPGWTVTGGSVDWVNAPFWNGPSPTDPFTVDLNGFSAGALEQSVTTTSGQTYALSFSLSANPGCGAITTDLAVEWDSHNVGSDYVVTPTWGSSSMVYTPEKATVTGTGNDTLAFVSHTTAYPGYCGPVIADVSLTPVASPVPVNTAPPTIKGTAQQGHTLFESNGSWTNNPERFAYQWLRCDGTGAECNPIPGATNQSYLLTSNDVDHTIEVQETASNTAGTSSPATSTPTAVVIAAPVPVNTTPPTISGTPEEGQTLVEHNGAWTNTPTTFGYQWMLCDPVGANCTAIPSATGQTYVPLASQDGHTIAVQETASNADGSGGPATSGPTAEVTALPVKANAGESLDATVGVAVTLDGSGSTPAGELTAYHWDFGDGSSADGAIISHPYSQPGTYTATLTVTGASGQDSATTTVVVSPAPTQAPSVTVVDAAGQPIVGADVLYISPSGARTSATSDGHGVAQLPGLPDGEDTIYAYKSGYQPAAGQLQVSAGAGQATITLQTGAVATVGLQSQQLTPEQIQAAGIDIYDPANQTVDSFQINLAFTDSAGNPQPVTVSCNINSAGQFVGNDCAASGAPSGGGGGGWSFSPGVFQGPGVSASGAMIKTTDPSTGQVSLHPVIQWLVLRGNAAILKQFFDVSMVVTNLSPEPFDLTGGISTLNLPAGMSLAPTATPQSLTQTGLTIGGSSSAETDWVVRGDKRGSYNLSAEYDGILQPFGDPVSLAAGLAQPLKVWGANALGLSVQADSGSLTAGSPYHVRLAVTNNADVPLYNINLSIDPSFHPQYIFQPRERFSDEIAELDPGQTVYSHTYIVVPDANSASLLNPPLSSATFAGQTPVPGKGISEMAPPALYPATALSDTVGKVHLQWQAVPGAQGYLIFSTPDLDASFTDTPDAAATTANGAPSTSPLPASATDAYVTPADSSARYYAVSAIIEGQPTLESPLVRAAPASKSQTTLSSSANPSGVGQQVTYTATVAASPPGAGTPTGTVAFTDAGASIAGCDSVTLDSGGKASCQVTYASAGSHQIKADYSGDQDFQSSSDSLTQTVQGFQTTTRVSSSANPSAFGQSVTFTATVSSSSSSTTPTGSVQFQIDGADVGGAVSLDSSGKATYSTSSLSVTSGTNHTVTAADTSDSGTFADSSGSLPGGQEVDKANTTTALSSSQNPVTLGQPLTLTATVTVNSPGAGAITGTVTFKDGTGTLGTGTITTTAGISSASYTTSSLVLGPHQITAVYGGSGTLAASTSTTLSQPVQYSVKLLFTPPLFAKPGTSVAIKLALQAYVGGRLKDVSSAGTTVTALCLVPAAASTCGGAPTLSLNSPFTYSSKLNGGQGGYQFNLKLPKTIPNGTYILLFRAAGESSTTYHADAGATITIGQVSAALVKALAVPGEAARIAQLLKHGGYVISFSAPSAGHLVITWYFGAKGAHFAKATRPVLVASANATFHHTAKSKVKITLTANGRELLKSARHLKLTAKGSFTPVAGTTNSRTKTIILTR